jgi:hypothetical protein
MDVDVSGGLLVDVDAEHELVVGELVMEEGPRDPG